MNNVTPGFSLFKKYWQRMTLSKMKDDKSSNSVSGSIQKFMVKQFPRLSSKWPTQWFLTHSFASSQRMLFYTVNKVTQAAFSKQLR